VLAVLGHRVFAGHDLIGPMFSGRKPAHLLGEHEAIGSSRLWLAACLLAVSRHGELARVARASTAVFDFE
jgi:hypothetical protein